MIYLILSYADQVNDLLTEFLKARFEKDEAKKAELQAKLECEILARNLGLFDKKIEKSGNGFLVGKSLSWVDVFLYAVLEGLGDKKDEVLVQFPNLKALVAKIDALPNIKAYKASRPVTALWERGLTIWSGHLNKVWKWRE